MANDLRDDNDKVSGFWLKIQRPLGNRGLIVKESSFSYVNKERVF